MVQQSLEQQVWCAEHGADGYYLVTDADGMPFTDDTDAVERLISAVPDLLGALDALFADYKELADSGDAGNWSLEDTEVGKQALAALAKATSK